MIAKRLKYFMQGMVLLMLSVPLTAQDTPQGISLAVAEGQEAIFRNDILPRFYEENLDIYVELVPIPSELYQDFFLLSATDQQAYLEAAALIASRADVHLVSPFTLHPEATRAGFFLDMKPLVSSDTTLSPDDFVPAAWQAYQWDNGFWALPGLITPLAMVYDQAVFDEKGLAYPAENWTFANFASAAQTLAAEGEPGLHVGSVDLPMLLRIFAGHPFHDGNIPAQPVLDTPEIASLLEQWSALQAAGIVSDFALDAPLRFSRFYNLGDENLNGVLLNGQAALDVYGIAISAGTHDPDAAYRLAVYLANAPELQTLLGDTVSAQYDLQELPTLPEHFATLYERAIQNALPYADVAFGHTLLEAISSVMMGITPQEALQNAQITAEQRLASAQAATDTLTVDVPAVTPPPVVSTDEVIIKFGLYTGSTEFTNRNLWENAIEDFLAEHPEIDDIDLRFIAPVQGYWDEVPKQDCVFGYGFYRFTDLGYYEPSGAEPLPLDPLINADASFDLDDVPGDVMQQMQRSGQTYALPMSVSPMILRYDAKLFEEAGVPQPNGTWTVTEFVDALQQLATVTEGEPFRPYYNFLALWEMLMAAYGASIVDYSTTPPTMLFADEAALPGIQQVLDLAKSGLIFYSPLATYFGFGDRVNTPPALVADFLSPYIGDQFEGMGFVTLPIGQNGSVPMSYYVSDAFIFEHAPHPEACYAWLRELSRHPELIIGMPAYHSVINMPETVAVYGAENVATFNHFADLMNSPERYFIAPFELESGERMFLGRAFDRYVLEDADLQTELQRAYELIEAYRICRETGGELDCITEVDPVMAEIIPTPINN